MEEFKKIEDYPIVGEISQEELSKYDDYIEKAIKESEKARIEDWKNQFLNNLIIFNVESLLEAKKRLNHTKKNYI